MQLSKLTVPSPKRLLPPPKVSSILPLLLVWIAIAAMVRFTNLAAKPLWTDEFATLVFSLGNSYQSVPLDEAISVGTLLQPLQTDLGGSFADAIANLMREDNHPPLYFIFAHGWMKLWPMGKYVSVWVARSLPAILGVLSVPAIYGLAQVAFGSAAIAHTVAALMAVSPYGVYLAQEARHYTLTIVFVIASLTCLVGAIRHFWHGTAIPWGLIGLWIVVNGLGFLSHYFFVLTLGAEAITFLSLLFWLRCNFEGRKKAGLTASAIARTSFSHNLWRASLAAVGTVTLLLAWLIFVLPDNYGSTMTDWIRQDNSNLLAVINPVFQLGAALVTMLFLLPVEAPLLPVAIVSGVLMFAFLVWVMPLLIWGAKTQLRHPYYHLGLRIALTFVGSAIAIFFAVTYLKGIDITRGARYSFVYFPGCILLLGGSLAACWQYGDLGSRLKQYAHFPRLKFPRYRFIQGNGKRTVALVMGVSFISAITVVSNLGYQKYYRPDRLTPLLEQSTAESVLLATTHETLVQTGEMMGLAWALKDREIAPRTRILLAHQPQKNSPVAADTLSQVLKTMPRSLDLWLVNFHSPLDLHNCLVDPRSFPQINGYDYKLYHCPEVEDIRALDEF
jgi:uncharacterized membrane protein